MNAEFLARGIMENFPEASAGSSLECRGWHYDDWVYTFVDEEEAKTYTLDKPTLLAAVPLMFSEEWLPGLTPVPANLLDGTEETIGDWLCQADATDFDAFIQLAIFGEVIYG